MIGRVGAMALLGAFLLAALPSQAEDGRLPGLWRAAGSTLIRCHGCLSVVRHGTVLTVVSEAGWSAVVNADNYGFTSYASGTGWWRTDIDAGRDAPFEVHLALKGSQLSVVFTTRSDRDPAPYVKISYERRPHDEDEGLGEVRKINISDE